MCSVNIQLKHIYVYLGELWLSKNKKVESKKPEKFLCETLKWISLQHTEVEIQNMII